MQMICVIRIQITAMRCLILKKLRKTCVIQNFGQGRIAHCRNVRGLEKNVVVFRLFAKLRYSDEKSTKFESPMQD